MKNSILYRFRNLMICFLLLTPLSISVALSEEAYPFRQMFPSPIQPWYFYSPSGVAVDHSRYVYISNRNSIVKMNADGHVISRWGKSGKENGEFSDAVGIAVDSRRYVYVADMNNHRIQKFTSDGQWIASWGKYGSADGELKQPHGIAVDAADNIYVADTGNHRIQILTSEGQFIRSFGNESLFNLPEGIAVDHNGGIYVADTNNDRILKFDHHKNLTDEWESEEPHAINVDASGFVYVSRKFDAIQKFSADGNLIREWRRTGSGDGEFQKPYGIAIDSKGFIYVADTENQRIQKFSSEINFVTRWGPNDDFGNFNSPKGVAVSKNGTLYVADTYFHRIQVFTADGIFAGSWGKSGAADGEFDQPTGIAVDSNGFVYVTDSFNNRIQKFDADGTFIRKWGIIGSDAGQCDSPYGITVDIHDAVYVTEWGNRRIQKFDSDGNLLAQWGKPGDGEGEFRSPLGIAVDSKGFVYVVDAARNCIQKFASDGAFVMKWGTTGASQGELNFPKGITVETLNGEDFIYVADSGNYRIQKFTSDGKFLTQWGEPGYGPGQMNYPEALAIGIDGAVVVADTDNHRIQIFDRISISSRAIIVAGGGNARGNYLWDATQKCANSAYWALMCQGFSNDDLVYLSPNTWLDLDGNAVPNSAGIPTTEKLRHAITENTTGIQHLIVYLVDHGGPSEFHMSDSDKDILYAWQLNEWLDSFQSLNPSARVSVIYDACKSGSFLAQLASESYSRMVITGASETEDAYFLSQGLISFSNLLWTEIFTGTPMRTAFDQAVKGMAEFQTPAFQSSPNIEDVCFGKCTPISDQPPVIIGGKILVTGNCYAEVTDDGNIERVWAQVRPQSGNSTASGNPVMELPSVDLTRVDSNRYDGVYDGFDTEGEYQVVIYAKDTRGYVSVPFIRSISVGTNTITGPDEDEPDDYRNQSEIIVVNDLYRKHSFHAAGDEDWMVFYARRDVTYAIELRNPGKNCFPLIELYENHAVNPRWVFDTSAEFTDTWEIRSDQDQDQIVYIRIRNRNPQMFGNETGYEFRIHIPTGTFSAYVKGWVKDEVTGDAIEMAILTTDAPNSAITRSDGGYLMNHPPGKFTIRTESAGYLPLEMLIVIIEGRETIQNFNLIPEPIATTTLPISDVTQDQTETIPEIENQPTTDVGGMGCFISIVGF